MKAQHKSAPRITGLKASPTPSRVRPPAPAYPAREETIDRARQRLASGFYDSEVCLDITVRRIARELRRPAVVVIAKGPPKLPGRSAQKGPRQSTGRG